MNYIIFDLEATCWEIPPIGYEQEIIEIGAFRVNQYGEVRGKFARFVRPTMHPNLSLFCKTLTGITQEDVNRAKTFPVVIEEFMEWARVGEENYVLGSWGNFDKKILITECKLHRMEVDWLESHINLKADYQRLRGSKRAIGMKKAVENEGLFFSGSHHRGIDDAENLTKLFLKFLGSWNC